ncbi:hypothetical protein [Streptomyces cinnamoneus]|uniref:Uncharacterized protein n=1 Tax=Streptomyces cinnamoneus TaxID=53446 RepID=A0A918TAS8_STRCJ|nr:hypothetical protein [Streptomyces cinnamoneus]GHC38540.1 hypothetical protein GCM10010507_10140 [Streptomyces cinnamoneus]
MVVYHPAGRDTALYAAVHDVKAGHWMQMRQVLACAPAAGSPADLNRLDHALTAGAFLKEAAAEFQAIGDYATPAPWQHITHHPDRWWEEFKATRSACLRRLKPPPNAGRRP